MGGGRAEVVTCDVWFVVDLGRSEEDGGYSLAVCGFEIWTERLVMAVRRKDGVDEDRDPFESSILRFQIQQCLLLFTDS